jgi:NTE family protein
MSSGTAFANGVRGGRHPSVQLLSALDEPSLVTLNAGLERVCIPGGEILFRENEAADALYVVMTGCLGVVVHDGHRGDVLVSRVAAGETVGEMALLDGGIRSATVVALRDSELLRLDKATRERLLEQHPRSTLSLLSLLARRLRITTRHADIQVPVRTVAIVPMEVGVDHCSVARDLVNRLTTGRRRPLLLDRECAGRSTEWFNAAEAASDLILYCAESSDSGWTKRCLRQADRVLLIASAGSSFATPPWLTGDGSDLRKPLDLIFLHDGRPTAGRLIERSHKRLLFNVICHVRRGNADDIARLARLVRGTAVGLVLSAGGARGFAHLGVIRALREGHIPIDLIGGCSMGAIVGAAIALEWDDAEIRERLQRAFVASNPINDYTLPLLSLVKGNKVARRLDEHFGGFRIEDLWRPFFCVSTNLSAGALAVHRDGQLIDALRASIAIPGILPPVMIDGEAHVDGGVMNRLPVDLMGVKRGPVIAVDVAGDPTPLSFEECSSDIQSLWQLVRRRRKLPPIVDLLLRAATVNSDTLGKAACSHADILFQPPLQRVDLLDWKACDRAIDAGYRHAIKKLEQLAKTSLPALESSKLFV